MDLAALHVEGEEIDGRDAAAAEDLGEWRARHARPRLLLRVTMPTIVPFGAHGLHRFNGAAHRGVFHELKLKVSLRRVIACRSAELSRICSTRLFEELGARNGVRFNQHSAPPIVLFKDERIRVHETVHGAHLNEHARLCVLREEHRVEVVVETL